MPTNGVFPIASRIESYRTVPQYRSPALRLDRPYRTRVRSARRAIDGQPAWTEEETCARDGIGARRFGS
jgi:hypothetical protein